MDEESEMEDMIMRFEALLEEEKGHQNNLKQLLLTSDSNVADSEFKVFFFF